MSQKWLTSASAPTASGSPESPLVHLGERGGQSCQRLGLRQNVRDLECWWHRNSGNIVGAPEHLFHQTGPRDKHVVHFTIQAMSQPCQGIQRDGSICLGMLQFTNTLGRHAQPISQRLGAHAQCQPNSLCPTAPGRGIALQLREIAKLPVKFGQAGEIQAVFQGGKRMRQQTGCLFMHIWATGLFPLGDGRTWNAKSPFLFSYLRTPRSRTGPISLILT